MIQRIANAVSRSRSDERGGDMVWTVLFIIPFMLILTFLMVDLGTMFATRYAVTNVVRDAVRQVSAYGSNCGPGECPYAPPPANIGVSFSQQAENRLNAGKGGTTCTYGPCIAEDLPIKVICGATNEDVTGVSPADIKIYPDVKITTVGQPIGCRVVGLYPYKGVTGGLLNTSLAAGFGGLVAPFPVVVLGRSEAGDNPNID